jgi:hypothetical protein
MTINDAKTRNEQTLMAIPGVVSVAIGEKTNGEPAIRVMVRNMTPALRHRLPSTVEGYPVEAIDLKGGEISAF